MVLTVLLWHTISWFLQNLSKAKQTSTNFPSNGVRSTLKVPNLVFILTYPHILTPQQVCRRDVKPNTVSGHVTTANVTVCVEAIVWLLSCTQPVVGTCKLCYFSCLLCLCSMPDGQPYYAPRNCLLCSVFKICRRDD